MLNRLVIDELSRAAVATGLCASEAVAAVAATSELRVKCVAAARATELDLHNRCGSTAVSGHGWSHRIALLHHCHTLCMHTDQVPRANVNLPAVSNVPLVIEPRVT